MFGLGQEGWGESVLETHEGGLELVVIPQMAFQGLRDEVDSAAVRHLDGCIQGFNEFVGDPGSDFGSWGLHGRLESDRGRCHRPQPACGTLLLEKASQ